LPSDERRDRWLQRQGYAVLRLSDALVLSSIGVAVALIAEQVVPLRS
jgi:very-short-patch-repair endonuclease